MFEGLTTVVSRLIPRATEFSMVNDRMLFAPYFEAAEAFCIENKVIIGGQVGINLLLGIPKHLDTFYWELYAKNTFSTSKQLADILYNVKAVPIDSTTVELQTNIKHREFTLRVNTRSLFKIYALDQYRQLDLGELLRPSLRPGYFTSQEMLVVPALMQLIDVYHQLYSPDKNANWEKLLEFEDGLFGLFDESITGGFKQNNKYNQTNKHNTTVPRDKLISKLGANVFIGDYSMENPDANKSRLQIISADPIETIARTTESIIPNITFVKYALNILGDFQLTKHTIYQNSNGKQIPLFDVFNSTQYEMVPFWNHKDKYKVGNPWVILRFQLIDIWVLKIINLLSTNNDIPARINKLYKNFRVTRESARGILAADPKKMFQLDKYAGIYMNEAIAKKKLITEQGVRIPEYYPAKASQGVLASSVS